MTGQNGVMNIMPAVMLNIKVHKKEDTFFYIIYYIFIYNY